MAAKKAPPTVREPMWDVDDVAARLGLKPGSVRNAITSDPTFPPVAKRTGNGQLWWSEDVEAWIGEHRPKDARRYPA